MSEDKFLKTTISIKRRERNKERKREREKEKGLDQKS